MYSYLLLNVELKPKCKSQHIKFPFKNTFSCVWFSKNMNIWVIMRDKIAK